MFSLSKIKIFFKLFNIFWIVKVKHKNVILSLIYQSVIVIRHWSVATFHSSLGICHSSFRQNSLIWLQISPCKIFCFVRGSSSPRESCTLTGVLFGGTYILVALATLSSIRQLSLVNCHCFNHFHKLLNFYI